MKVLVLAQYFPPDMGGGSTRASNVVKGLLSKGCQVTVVAAFPHYPHGRVPERYKFKAITFEQCSNAKIYRVWIPALPHSSAIKRIFLHFCFIFSSLFALPFVGKVDVIWCSNPNLFCFLPSFIYSSVKRIPIVRNVDDLWPEVFYELGYVKSKFAKKALGLIAWFSYAVPAAITPISEGYKRRIISNYGIDESKIKVIMVGVESIKPLLNTQRKLNRFTVMYSGVLGLGYDFNIIIEAARLLSNHDSISFVIRGVGELAPPLKKAVRTFGLRNVVVADQFLPKNELTALLESADVFVLPMAKLDFVDSGLPTKVFEYQSYGKPIICVSNGESAKYVQSTGSGLTVKHGDIEGFVNAVLRLYSDPGLSIELGSRGCKYVAENLALGNIGESMYCVFKSVLLNVRDP